MHLLLKYNVEFVVRTIGTKIEVEEALGFAVTTISMEMNVA